MIQSNFPAPAWLDLKTFAPQPYAQPGAMHAGFSQFAAFDQAARAAKDAVIFLKVEVRIDDSFRSLV